MWFTRSNDVRVVAGTYQFFTGSIPGAAGFEFLIESSANATDLSDSYYAQFNIENRFINFANNLGVAGAGASKFQSDFGGLTFEQTIRKAYDMIVGLAEAQAAGINTETAIQFFINSQSFYQAVAQERVVPGGTPLDQATKIVALGSIINEAIKAGVGKYATAVNAFVADVTPDGTSALLGGSLSTGGTLTLTPGHDRIDATVGFLNGPENLVPFRFTASSETVRAPAGTLRGPDTLIDPSTADDDLIAIDLSGAFPINLSYLENIEHYEITFASFSGQSVDFEGARGADTLVLRGSISDRTELLNVDKTTFTEIDASRLGGTDGGYLFVNFVNSIVPIGRTIIGSSSRDAIGGSLGNDVITGGGGHDLIVSNAGNDIVRGGAGSDIISVGAGSDIIIFEASAAANDLDILGGAGESGFTPGPGGDKFDFTAFLGGPAAVLKAQVGGSVDAAASNVVILGYSADLDTKAELVAAIGSQISIGGNRDIVVLMQAADGDTDFYFVETAANGRVSTLSVNQVANIDWPSGIFTVDNFV